MAEAYCWEAGMSAYHGQALLCLCHRSGCAEGQSPFAEGLGVPPNFLISPQEWGIEGVEEGFQYSHHE